MSKGKGKVRNHVVLNMITCWWGAGSHGDKKKEKRRKACRGRYKGD